MAPAKVARGLCIVPLYSWLNYVSNTHHFGFRGYDIWYAMLGKISVSGWGIGWSIGMSSDVLCTDWSSDV